MSQHEQENTKWWFFSDSVESLSTAFQSIANVTSSTRSFFTGCFHCNRGSNGCFKKGDLPANGAWFDCEQLQVEHPYCYVNPVALDHDDGSSKTKDNKMYTKSKECNGISVSKPPVISQQPVDDEIKNDLRHYNSKRQENSNSNNGEIKNPTPKYKKYKNGITDPSSFVSKLEREHFGFRKDALRSEGEVVVSGLTRSGSDRSIHKPSIRSPIWQRKNLQSTNIDVEIRSWDEESFGSLEDEEESEKEHLDLFGEVWRPNELENAFEVYNLSTVQSLGYLNYSAGAQKKLSRKNSPEKFEDFFPTQLNKYNSDALNNEKTVDSNSIINNNSLKHLEDSSEKEIVSQRIKKENVIIKENDDNKVVLSEKELNELIKLCIFVDNLNELDLHKQEIDNKKFLCDNLLTYCGKSFNRKLIFDLVKEIKNDCIVQYSNSIVLCDEYPVNIVQNKVISALKFNEKYQCSQIHMLENIENLRQRMLLSNDINEIGKVPEEILIENLTAEEIRKEGKLWQIVDTEENSIKKKLCEEIFNEFLNKELSVLTNVFKIKENACNKYNNS